MPEMCVLGSCSLWDLEAALWKYFECKAEGRSLQGHISQLPQDSMRFFPHCRSVRSENQIIFFHVTS